MSAALFALPLRAWGRASAREGQTANGKWPASGNSVPHPRPGDFVSPALPVPTKGRILGEMTVELSYRLVTLRNGARSLYSCSHGEILHPGAGPVREAESLYVRQLRLRERMMASREPFVVWDVGLGAAANATAVLRAGRGGPAPLRLISFDFSVEPLAVALEHSVALGFLDGFESAARVLATAGEAVFDNEGQAVRWELKQGDFPALLASGQARLLPPPHAILYDPFSPAKNPSMWTLNVFQQLHEALDPGRSCALATYSRSTLVRTALLLAGFFVGRGLATEQKEETTVAANDPALIDQPLDAAWLDRAQRSGSAEPLDGSTYRQVPLSRQNLDRLKAHPQFAATVR